MKFLYYLYGLIGGFGFCLLAFWISVRITQRAEYFIDSRVSTPSVPATVVVAGCVILILSLIGLLN